MQQMEAENAHKIELLLKEKNEKLAASSKAHEAEVARLKAEVLTTQEKSKRLEELEEKVAGLRCRNLE